MAVMSHFQFVKTRRISDEIGDQIRKMLASSELNPGDKLPAERELALQLGVGRNAVREAIRSLESSGVLKLQKGARGGAFIGHGDPLALTQGLRDLLQLRAVSIEHLTEARVLIEQAVTRAACLNATAADLQEMENHLNAADAALIAEDYEGKLSSLIEFHRALARATQNPVMAVMLGALLDLMHSYARTVGLEKNDLSIHALRKVLSELKARDQPGAVREVTDHLERLRDRYIAYQSGKQAPGPARKT